MMQLHNPEPVRLALLDLYAGEENQGIRCIRELIQDASRQFGGRPIICHEFDVRQKGEVPGLDYDIYISSGGPGSPLDGAGQEWEANYFSWLDSLWNHNLESPHKKHALFICHSFQLMCRFFNVAQVTKRPAQSFGIFPVHRTQAGWQEPLFEGLSDPFYAADFRRWQVVQPDKPRLDELGASILAIEQPYEEHDWERAVMGVRMSPEIIGLQFHPEADPAGMLEHFKRPKERNKVVQAFCKERYQRLMHRLREPEFLVPTHNTVVPTFLQRAVAAAHRTPATSSVA